MGKKLCCVLWNPCCTIHFGFLDRNQTFDADLDFQTQQSVHNFFKENTLHLSIGEKFVLLQDNTSLHSERIPREKY